MWRNKKTLKDLFQDVSVSVLLLPMCEIISGSIEIYDKQFCTRSKKHIVQTNEDVKILKNISKPSDPYKQAQVRVH